MNHNEEVPDFLGGLGDMLPADVLKKVNELLEQLHRKDKNHQGSHLQIVYVASGGQHVETQINMGKTHPGPETHPGPPCVGREKGAGELPEEDERIRQSIVLLMKEQYGDEPLFNLQGHWQAVYRILVDKGYCRDSDFDGFDTLIRRVMPEEVNKPYKKDSVRNINKTSFNKPFDKWRYDPDDYGTRKPFERMVAIARRFKEILEENGL